MEALDWLVLGAYIAAMLGMSVYLSKGQETADDYYVGGRNLPWWAVGISTMATQTSANSFIGIPAYVALKEGGGLTWLQYELAVPLAMVFVMVFLIPLFRDLKLISVYEYLEMRFDRRTRLVMSAVFLVSRGLATGIGVYASAVVLEVCLGLPVWQCIIIIGIVTIIYDTIGGMAAVVYSDVVQMFVLLGGLGICIYLAMGEAGGLSAAIAAHAPERLEGIDPSHGVFDGGKAPLWGFLVGGFVLYVSYYGVDQSQAQRELSAPTTDDTKRSLVFNGLARFPLTLLYIAMGLAVGAAYHAAPDLQAAVPDDKLDYLIPMFVLHKLPVGVRGVLFAALLAASMSSLDSALNSLSASTMRDFIEPHIASDDKAEHDRNMLRASKLTTVLWGIAMTVFAFFVGGISDTVVEGINKLGAFFYGPILAAFLAGILDRRAVGPGMLAGVFLGVGANCVLWLWAAEMYWMWWNVTGLIVAVVTTAGVSRMLPPPDPKQLEGTTLRLSGIAARERGWAKPYLGLVVYFIAILLVAVFSDDILASFV
jgi:SSS family solute:Na+ symporter